MLLIDPKKILELAKSEIPCKRDTFLVMLMVKKLTECFMRKNCRREIRKNLELRKNSKEIGISYMPNEKAIIISFNS